MPGTLAPRVRSPTVREGIFAKLALANARASDTHCTSRYWFGFEQLLLLGAGAPSPAMSAKREGHLSTPQKDSVLIPEGAGEGARAPSKSGASNLKLNPYSHPDCLCAFAAWRGIILMLAPRPS